MKTRLLTFILSLVMVVCLALGLTACTDPADDTSTNISSSTQTDSTQNADNSGTTGNSEQTDSTSSTTDSGTGSSETEKAEDFTYKLNSDKASYMVTGIGTVTATDLVIPSEYNGMPVTIINTSAFANNMKITSVVIPSSITHIYSKAFNACTKITSITLSEGLEVIGPNAFYCNILVKEIVIPDSVTKISDNAFEACDALEKVTLGKNLETIGALAFKECPALETIVMNEKLTTIGASAFNSCSALTSFDIPASVTFIDNAAFYGCTLLADITGGDGITGLGMYIFHDTAYYNNADNWQNGLLYYKTYLICADTALTGDVVISDSTTIIADYAFTNCTSVTSVDTGSGVTSISELAFLNCTSLKNIVIGENVTEICYSAFNGCSSLESVTIPKSVISIKYYAFEGCTSLTAITFENATGWQTARYEDGTDAFDIDVSDEVENITFFTDTYLKYFWFGTSV